MGSYCGIPCYDVPGCGAGIICSAVKLLSFFVKPKDLFFHQNKDDNKPKFNDIFMIELRLRQIVDAPKMTTKQLVQPLKFKSLT